MSTVHRVPSNRPAWRARVGAGVALALLGCATENGWRKELDAMREDLAAQHRANDELRIRVEQLEARTAPHAAVATTTAPAAATPEDPLAAVGSLPIVRVQPPPTVIVPPAPPVDTHIPMRDPTTGDMASLDRGHEGDDQPVNLNAIIERRTPAETAFSNAMSYYSARDWKSAAFAFRKFVTRYPKDGLASKALYMEGMSLSADERCSEALPVFNQLLKAHPKSDSVSPTMLGLAQCEAKLGHPERARPLLQRIMAEHPESAEAPLAKAKLDELGVGDRS